VYLVAPLLVRVIRRAGPNLQLRPINKPSLWYVQAFGAEHFNDASAESPFLRSRAGARLDGNYGRIVIGGSGQAFCCVSMKLVSMTEESQDALKITDRR